MRLFRFKYARLVLISTLACSSIFLAVGDGIADLQPESLLLLPQIQFRLPVRMRNDNRLYSNFVQNRWAKISKAAVPALAVEIQKREAFVRNFSSADLSKDVYLLVLCIVNTRPQATEHRFLPIR